MAVNRRRAALARSGKIVAPRGVQPNVGVRRAYEAKLLPMIRRMHRDVIKGVLAIYGKLLPSEDAAPGGAGGPPRAVPAKAAVDAPRAPSVAELDAFFQEMMEQWGLRWEAMSEAAAEAFATAVAANTGVQFTQILRDMGFAIQLNPTAATRGFLATVMQANADLIKTIPEQYLMDVRALVNDSLFRGRDLGGLEADLVDRYHITERRARMIAKDQSNKATQGLARLEAEECGITRAIWHHVTASRHPRPTHQEMDGTEYEIAQGCWDPEVGRHIQPGELVNCNCRSRWVVPGGTTGLANRR
jgi:uncharacterized protein with gpF-like domain